MGGLSQGWNINNFGQARLLDDDGKGKTSRIVFWDHGGSYALYEGKYSKSRSKPDVHAISPNSISKGVTNTGTGLSGATNIKNNRLNYVQKTGKLTCELGNGVTREYSGSGSDRIFYVMSCEKYPNGNKTFYAYTYPTKYDERVCSVSLENKEKKQLSSFRIEYQGDEKFDLITSDNRQVSYFFKKYKCHLDKHGRYYLDTVLRPDGQKISYEYSNREGRQYEQLIKKSLPDGRYLINEYYKKGMNELDGTLIDLPSHDVRIGRVKCQKAPVGVDSTPIVTHRFIYHVAQTKNKENSSPLNGITTVLDANNNKTDYVFNADQRPSLL